MTPTQYDKALATLGLTQAGVAKLFGISIRSAHGYAHGAKISSMVAILLHLLLAGKITKEDIERARK
jgi:hypothetical protein